MEVVWEWGRKTRQSLSLKEGGNIAKTETQVKEIRQTKSTFPRMENKSYLSSFGTLGKLSFFEYTFQEKTFLLRLICYESGTRSETN